MGPWAHLKATLWPPAPGRCLGSNHSSKYIIIFTFIGSFVICDINFCKEKTPNFFATFRIKKDCSIKDCSMNGVKRPKKKRTCTPSVGTKPQRGPIEGWKRQGGRGGGRRGDQAVARSTHSKHGWRLG